MPAWVTFTAISAGPSHSVALDAAGRAWAWGANNDGDLGNGTGGGTSSIPIAVSMPAGLAFKAISAGYAHSVALDTNGNAWAWGSDTRGQLGNGPGPWSSSTPVAVTMPAGITFTAIAAGEQHNMALDAAGHAWGWGDNSVGLLGDGTSTDQMSPVAVQMPPGVTFNAIDAGGFFTVAPDPSGHAWAWGDNYSGQLGNGTTQDTSHPVAVSMPPGVSFTAIVNGGDHTLALDGAGNGWTWGTGAYGQRGDGSSVNSSVPGAVSMPSGVSFIAISAGMFHDLALTVAPPPRTAEQQLSDLLARVQGTGKGTSLSKPVSAAQKDLQAGNLKATCHDLDEFIKKVQKASGDTIDPTLATSLVDDAKRIQALIAC